MYDSGEISELSYFYRLPQEVRESSLKILAAYVRLSQANAKKLASEIDLTSCVKWCFDETEGRASGELQYLASQVAVKAGLDEIVREILLNAFLGDQLKIDLLCALAERNEFDCYGVVICNVYKRVTMQQLFLGRTKKKNFIQAYSRLVAHFSILDDEHGKAFAAATESLYADMENTGRLDAAKDIDGLTAAIYLLSGVREANVTDENVYAFFDVSSEQINKITGK